MGRTVVVIQSRFNSTRLPGKALLPLAGKPLLEHIIDRAEKMNADDIILTTGKNPTNSDIVKLAIRKGCELQLGDSEADVLKRFYDATSYRRYEYIVRVTGDNPLVDVDLANKLIKKELKEKADYYGMLGIPIGVGVEIFRKTALDRAHMEARHRSDREHVCTYIKVNSHIFSVKYLDMKVYEGDLRLTVDYQKDYDFVSKIYDELYKGKSFSTGDVLKLLKKKPELLS